MIMMMKGTERSSFSSSSSNFVLCTKFCVELQFDFHHRRSNHRYQYHHYTIDEKIYRKRKMELERWPMVAYGVLKKTSTSTVSSSSSSFSSSLAKFKVSHH